MKSLQCDRCGASLSFQDELGGRCARCLLQMAVVGDTQKLDDQDPENFDGYPRVGTHVGRYRILRPIGDGGMGIVYEAEQEQTLRHVAVKLIRPGVAAKATLRRFEREAQALGRLQHPGIAQIFEAGQADTGFGPQPYFAMELIRGLTPGEYVKQHRLSVRDRLELVAKVADAVHHAHQRGIIHRDLKPSNILIDETGQPKVLDFGVSRAIDDHGLNTRQTEMGQLLGTVAYMSPEQVKGDPHDIDIRTDIYALGVILYELLANRAPYDVEGNLPDLISAIREAEPIALGMLDRIYKGDIETIAARALEKDKNRRYTSAAELAADIRRFLSEQPIIARPPTATYQLKKFARRNKVLVIAAFMVTLALVLGVIGSTWQARRARLAQQAALVDRDRALRAEAMATDQRNLALEAQRQAVAAGEIATAERDRANVERNRAQQAEEQARRDAQVAKTQSLVATTQQLVREALRTETARDDYDLASALIVQAQRFSARLSPEPRYAVEDALQKAMLWNPLPHNIVTGSNNAYRSIAFSPDGAWLAAGGDDEKVRVWNMRHPADAPLFLDATGTAARGITAVTFSNNGKLLAVASSRQSLTVEDGIRIWDMEKPLDPPLILKGASYIDSLAFSPDDTYLASASAESHLSDRTGTIFVWNLRKPDAVQVLYRAESKDFPAIPIQSGRVSFSPDGTRLAAALVDSVRVWELRHPDAVPIVLPWSEVTAPTSAAALRSVHSVAFSPDGVHLATSSSAGVFVWDLRSLQTAPVALTAAGQTRLLTYSRDGGRLAGVHDSISIWDVRNPAARPTIYTNNGRSHLSGMAFSLDGTRVAGATAIGIHVWDTSPFVDPSTPSDPVPRGPLVDPVDPSRPGVVEPRNFVYSEDLTRAVDATGNLQVWDLRHAPPRAVTLEGYTTPRPFSSLSRLLIGSDFDRVMSFCRNNTRFFQFLRGGDASWLSVWDLGVDVMKPLLVTNLDLHLRLARILACSPDGTRLAVTDHDGVGPKLRIIDHTGSFGNSAVRPLWSLGPGAAGVTIVGAFSPDGNKLAVGMGQAAYLWNIRDSTKTGVRVFPHTPAPGLLALSSDGSRLGVASSVERTGHTAVWDLRHPGSPPQRLPPTSVMAFSHDGGRLATSNGSTVRIWDLRIPGTPPVNFQWTGRQVVALAFTPDNLTLKVGDLDGRVVQWRLWSAAAEILCTRIWRNLSMSEWQAHVGEGIPYEKTCPNLPPGAGAPGRPK